MLTKTWAPDAWICDGHYRGRRGCAASTEAAGELLPTWASRAGASRPLTRPSVQRALPSPLLRNLEDEGVDLRHQLPSPTPAALPAPGEQDGALAVGLGSPQQ